jgi:hypothetical protein
VAYLNAATGQVFSGTPGYSSGTANGTQLNLVVGFPSVLASANLLDTASQPATGCQATPSGAYLLGSGYYIQTQLFTQVGIYAATGTSDTGYLADGPAGGTLVGDGSSAIMLTTPYSLGLYDFAQVIAVGSTGTNTKQVGPITFGLTFQGTWM